MAILSTTEQNLSETNALAFYAGSVSAKKNLYYIDLTKALLWNYQIRRSRAQGV